MNQYILRHAAFQQKFLAGYTTLLKKPRYTLDINKAIRFDSIGETITAKGHSEMVIMPAPFSYKEAN